MKIGFDISQTGSNKAGCGYFADSLIRDLAKIDEKNQYILYGTFGDFYWDTNHSDKSYINQSNFQRGLIHLTYHEAQTFWKNFPDDYELQLGSPDIIHINNFFCPIRKFPHSKLIYTLYDLSFIAHPEWTTENNRVGCFDGVFNASINADFIIAISNYTREHFLNIFPHYPQEKITVVYPACRFTKRLETLGRPKRFSHLQPNSFWLSVGTLEPRKNHKRLVEAYAKLRAQQTNVMPLVLAGGTGWMMDDFKQKFDQGLQQNVIFLGYVSDNELQWLYQNCYCLIYPSLFEGFGLPVLEAMTLGAPVITSNVSSMPEILGSAGILVNPYESEEIFQAMLRLLGNKNYCEILKVQSLQQAKKFSHLSSGQMILDLYQQI